MFDLAVRIALALVSAGGVLYGARYSSAIADGQPEPMRNLCLVVVSAAILLVLRQWRVDRTANKFAVGLKGVADETRDLIYRLPHVKTITGVALAQRDVITEQEAVLRKETRLDQGLPTALLWLARGLSSVAGLNGRTARTVVNVMLWIPKSEYEAEEGLRRDLQEQMPFCKETNLASLEGVLQIDTRLSAMYLDEQEFDTPHPGILDLNRRS